MVPAVAAFTATSAAEVNNGVSWLDAARDAADFWLLGHGGVLRMGTGQAAASVTVIPLGIIALSVLSCRFLARVSAAHGWWLVGFGTLGYAGTAALVMFTMTTSVARQSAPSGLATAVGVAGLGFVWGNYRRDRASARLSARSPAASTALAPRLVAWCRATLPAWVRAIPSTSALIVAAVLATATMLTLIWLVTGYGRFGDLATSLDAGLIGGVVLALLSIAFWPNMAAFGVAYLAGPGFSIGAATVVAPGDVTLGPMPSLPLIGIVPQSAYPGGVWLAALPVAAAAAGAWWMFRRIPRSAPWWTMAAGALASSLAAAAALALAVVAASGSAGPGRMAEIGAPWWPVFAALALELTGGCVPVVLIACRRMSTHKRPGPAEPSEPERQASPSTQMRDEGPHEPE
ncbi:MAG: DUF6350 family protein [Bifidobacteriaceae bacterium]|nr:DUF6350 family protein [Bifidobacteriaceae bacterium]